MAEAALEVQLRADVAAFQAGMNQAIGQLTKLQASARQVSTSTNQMASSMRLVAASMTAFVGAQAIQGLNALQRSFIQMVEGPQNLQASFKALLGDGDRAVNMLQRVYKTAKETGVAFDQTAEITQKMTVGLKDMGASNAQIQTMTETLLKLGTIGGSSIADTAGAALQLAQALGSGKLQGDELRSIMERMPLLGQAIAKEMGVSVGQLKSLGAEGKITSDIIANSLLKSATNVNELFKAMPLTVGRALNNIKTAFTEGFDTSAARSAVSSLASAINELQGFAGNLSRGLVTLATDLAELYNSSANIRAGFEGAAIGIGVLLTALAPIPVAIAAATAGVVALIANWDKVKDYFSTELLPAFQKFIAEFNLQMDSLIAIVKQKISPIITEFSRLKALWADLNAGLAGAGKETIGAATAAGSGIDYMVEANRRYEESIKRINEGQAAARAAVVQRKDDLDKAAAATANISNETNKLNAAIADTGKKGGADSLKTWANNLINSADAARKYAQDMERLSEALKKGYISQEEFALGAERLKKQMTDAQSKTSGLATEMSQFASNAGNAFFDAIANGKSFGKVLQSLALDLAKLLFQMLVIKPLLGSLFGGGGGGLGSLFGGGTRSIHPTTRAFAIGSGGPAGVTRAAGSFASQISARGLLADGGGVNVGNISISVAEGSGTSTGDTETGKALGDRIKQAVLMTLVQERRPGGILAGTR
jgi:tape measure domain-containing protein